jgi:cytochrome c oxidase subunit 4
MKDNARHDGDGRGEAAHGPGLAKLALVFTTLMALLAVTVAAAFVHLGAWALPVTLAIATVKATLVMLWFMHLRYESGLVRVFAGAGLLWLTILLLLTLADYLTRSMTL